MTLLVHVFDGDSPIHGARVVDDHMVAISDERGGATIRGLWRGFQMVEVVADGYAPMSVAQSLAYEPGATIERTVQLTRGTAMRGTVLAADDTPVADARVRIIGPSWGGEVRTDSTGVWQFDCIAPGGCEVWAVSVYGPTPHVTSWPDGATTGERPASATTWSRSCERSPGDFITDRTAR